MSQKTIKIYDGDTLTTDALYCRNTETGEIGWYDYISEKFYPAPLKQYIDTGIDPASLRPKGEWISVEDRLPKDWEDVLVLLQCGDCIVAVRSGKYWRERWCHSMLDRPPTHWMPLPEPPNCGADMRGEAHDS